MRSSLFERLWSPIPWQRLQNMAEHAPELMDFYERILWHRIKLDKSLWNDVVGTQKINSEAIENAWRELVDTHDEYCKKVGAT